MNEKLQESLSQILDTTLNGVDFLKSELPDVIHQLLMWKMAESLVMCVFGLLMFVFGGLYLWKNIGRGVETDKGFKRTMTHDEDGDLTEWFPLAAVPVLVVIITVCTPLNITWLQIWLAPKVYLIEYAAQLTK